MPEEVNYTDDFATFGDRLAAARQSAGLEQAALASKIGVKSQTVAAWEDDRKEPRANRLQMLSGILGVSLSWLITGRGEGPSEPQTSAEKVQAELLIELRSAMADLTSASEKIAHIEARLRALELGEEADA